MPLVVVAAAAAPLVVAVVVAVAPPPPLPRSPPGLAWCLLASLVEASHRLASGLHSKLVLLSNKMFKSKVGFGIE